MARLDLLHETMVREARVAGMRPDALSTTAIKRRRRQLEAVALLVFFGLVLTTLRTQIWGATAEHDALIDPQLLRAAMITCAGAFIAYALEKEKHLRRLTVLDLEARQTNLHIADAILRAAALTDDVEFMHATLALDDVVERVAARARRRLDAAESAVRLLVADGELPVVASRVGPGGPVAGGRRVAVAEQAALARAAVRSDDGTVAAAPLVHDGRLLGVVEVVRAAFDPFDDDDLAVLDAIAQPAARAIGHARAYRALRKRAESGD